jgi:hypothetical protein
MSKGSGNRTKDRAGYRDNYDRIFKAKKRPKKTKPKKPNKK